MSASLEREIKLRFSTPDAARAALAGAGATLLRGRRLQQDLLLDTADARLRDRQSALRIRREGDAALLTFKGPAQAGETLMKVREEVEVGVADADVMLRVLEAIGFAVWFRYEKYREEYSWRDVIAAIDETPVGTFVEIEGSAAGIVALAEALGRSADDYLRDSYRGLFVQHCAAHKLSAAHMVFDR